MSYCAWCGMKTDKPITEFFSHFQLYDHTAWQYLRGNIEAFGKYQGIVSTIYLMFPAICSLRFWKNRRKYLRIDESCVTVERR